MHYSELLQDVAILHHEDVNLANPCRLTPLVISIRDHPSRHYRW
jgi:hypothetical protein